MYILKAIIYRIIRTGIIFLSSFLITHQTTVALSIISIDVVLATLFYYFYDISWNKIEKYIKNIYIRIKYYKMNKGN